MSYDGELENCVIFDVRFKASNADSNDIWILLSCTKDWREYEALDNELRYGNWNLQPTEFSERVYISLQSTSRRHAILRSQLSQAVRDLARAKGLDA
jgi:hypothetical protein